MKYDPMKILIIMILVLLALPTFAVRAETPQALLNQYISELQKNPNDAALREKIIRHAQAMKPKPAVPEDARRHFIEGNTLLKAAKDQRGYGLARDAYRQCLLIAPWWADAYNNYAVALELSGQFDDAVSALKLYIATNPGESESRKAQDKIYEIGAKKKIAAQEKGSPTPNAVSSPQMNAFEDLLNKINGRRYTSSEKDVDGIIFTLTIDVNGKVFKNGSIGPQNYKWPELRGYVEGDRHEIRGRETTVSLNSQFPHQPVSRTYAISEDGERITMLIRWRSGNMSEYVYLRQR